MSRIQWSTDFEIGHKVVDLQHKKLVEMVNALGASVGQDTANASMATVLKELVDYTKYHFQTEEQLMREIGYPELEQHIEKHKRLVSEVVQILSDLKEDRPVTITNLLNFLSHWLVDHILAEDTRIGKYLREQRQVARLVPRS